MISCGSCGATNASGPASCAKCGAILDPLAPPKTGTVQDLKDEAILKDLEAKDRLKRRRRTHALVGAITFFLLFTAIRLPASIHPYYLVTHAVTSCIFGLPIGWLISKAGGGAYRGGFISAGVFLGALLLVGLVRGQNLAVPGLMLGLLAFLPGAIIGLHVDADD